MSKDTDILKATFDISDKIPKSINDRILELTYALRIIRDSIKWSEEGKYYQLIPMYGQLRALLWGPTKSNIPLLFDLAEKINVQLKIWAMPDADPANLPKEIREIEGLHLHVASLPLTLAKSLPGQQEINFADYMKWRPVYFKEKLYSTEDIIRSFAEKAGGAHYDPDLPQDFAELLQFSLNGEPVLVNLLRQIGKITYDLGKNLYSKVSDFGIYSLLVVPEQELSEVSTIFEYTYPEKPSGFSLLLDSERRLIFKLSDLGGENYTIRSEVPIVFGEPFIAAFGIGVEDDLNSSMYLMVDGNIVEFTQPHSIQIRNDLLFYNKRYSRGQKDQSSLLVGYSEIIGVGQHSVEELVNLYHYLANKKSYPTLRDLKLIWVFEDGYGHSESGTNDIKFEGTVKLASLEYYYSNSQSDFS